MLGLSPVVNRPGWVSVWPVNLNLTVPWKEIASDAALGISEPASKAVRKQDGDDDDNGKADNDDGYERCHVRPWASIPEG